MTTPVAHTSLFSENAFFSMHSTANHRVLTRDTSAASYAVLPAYGVVSKTSAQRQQTSARRQHAVRTTAAASCAVVPAYDSVWVAAR